MGGPSIVTTVRARMIISGVPIVASVSFGVRGHVRAFKAATCRRTPEPETRTKNHSPFTTFRHSATNRLHASWQSSGTVAGVALSAVALAKADDPGSLGAWT